MEVTVYSMTDLFIDGRKFSSPVDHWQHGYCDNVSHYTIQRAERREAAQTAGSMFNP